MIELQPTRDSKAKAATKPGHNIIKHTNNNITTVENAHQGPETTASGAA